MRESVSALTSSKVVVLLAWLPGAEACAFGCGSSQEGGPCRAEHHHLLQLGVVIHGGVWEAQRLGDLQGRKDHLGLGCSHTLLGAGAAGLRLRCWLTAKFREARLRSARVAPRRWREPLRPAQGTLHASADAEEDAVSLRLRVAPSPAVLSLRSFSGNSVKIHLSFTKRKNVLFTHSLKK